MNKLLALLSVFTISAAFACPNREMVDTQSYQGQQYQNAPRAQMMPSEQDFSDTDLDNSQAFQEDMNLEEEA
ncbi:hypothetical protein H0X48_00155 [Candidatus Dependentiae bacterium]|nr:hypothetical protein [Candidatus Dependentiae bacterium]